MKPSRSYESAGTRTTDGLDTATGSNALAYLGAVLLAVSVACVLVIERIAALGVSPYLALGGLLFLQVVGAGCLLASLSGFGS